MELKIYQVDAFANRVFEGNPAAVVPLVNWLDDILLQKIALENNLSETAFFVKVDNVYEIRWFTPTVEVDLCGHATLATAHTIFQHFGHEGDKVSFFSRRSGSLNVSKNGKMLTLDFPKDDVKEVKMHEFLLTPFEQKPIAAFKGKTDYVLLFDNEDQIKNLEFDLQLISKIPCRGIIVTAKGDNVDFVSRFFGPRVGVPEDPVTGSAHTTLTPIWAEKLTKNKLNAVQLSDRRGELVCELEGDRVKISGMAVTYLVGTIYLPN